MPNDQANTKTEEPVEKLASQHLIASKNKFSLSKKVWGWIAGSAVVLLAFAGYITYAVYSNLETDAASCVTKTYSSGSSSTCVKYAQQLLNGVSEYFSIIPTSTGTSISKSSISVSGKFDSGTTDRLKAFQAYDNTSTTGKLTKNVWYNLCKYTQSAYSSFSTNLRSKAIATARTAYTKAGCSSATQEIDTSQDTNNTTANDDNISDIDENSVATNSDGSTSVSDSERDVSATQIVDDTISSKQSLTVVTWNIAGGSANFNASERLEGLRTLETSADIISLQESHKADFRTMLRDQYLCDICASGGASVMQGLQFEGIPVGSDIYSSNSTPPASVPILWKRDRFTLEGYGAYTILAKVYNDESGNKVTRKWITWVRLHDKVSGKSFYTLNLHTPAGVENNGSPVSKMKKRNSTYQYAMQLIQTIVKNNSSGENLPIIITGDFNVDYRTDKVVKYKYFPYATMANLGFTSNWAYAEESGGLPSGGSGSSNRLIDYVFIKRGVGLGFSETSINTDMFGSDHHPVSATIVMQ